MRNTFLLVLLGFVGLAISASQEDEQTTELEEALDEDTLETSGELEELDELTEDEDESLEISRTERDADPEKTKGRKEKNRKGKSSKGQNKSGKNQKNKSSKPKKKGRKAKKPSTKQYTKAKNQRKIGKIHPAGDERIACSRTVK